MHPGASKGVPNGSAVFFATGNIQHSVSSVEGWTGMEGQIMCI